MHVDEARRVLGLETRSDLDITVVRATYRRLVRTAHPDVNAHPGAADRTAKLTVAYRVLTEAIEAAASSFDAAEPPPGSPADGRSAAPGQGGPTTSTPPRPGTHGQQSTATQRPAGTGSQRPQPDPAPIEVTLVSDDTISIAAPAEEAFMLVLDAAHDLGEIGYLDLTAGLVEVIVEFVEAPTSSVLFTFQGRANASTEVFCTVEPLSGGEAPPTDAVTRLVLDTLREAQR